MKNNKGFTLIELLAVVVILLAISTIAITSISAAVERNKEKQNDAKKKVIVSYAELYYAENKNNLISHGKTSGCISISSLNLTDDEAKDANGEYFTGGVKYTNGSNFEYVDRCN